MDAIKAVVSNRSVLALGALKKVIDRRISDLEQARDLIEQKVAEMGQRPPESGQTTQKNEQKRGGRRTRVYNTSLILKRYGTTSVFKPVLDEVLRLVGDEFTRTDISSIIYDHYKNALKREIMKESSDVYADHYITYMLSERIIEKADTRDKAPSERAYIWYRRTKNQKSVERRERDLGIINGTRERDATADKIRERRMFEEEVCGGTKD